MKNAKQIYVTRKITLTALNTLIGLGYIVIIK